MSDASKFNTGDKVRVINYGHLAWEHKNAEMSMFEGWAKRIGEGPFYTTYDTAPDLIGQEGIVCKATLTQGKWKYALEGIAGKSAWYDEDQLESL